MQGLPHLPETLPDIKGAEAKSWDALGILKGYVVWVLLMTRTESYYLGSILFGVPYFVNDHFGLLGLRIYRV